MTSHGMGAGNAGRIAGLPTLGNWAVLLPRGHCQRAAERAPVCPYQLHQVLGGCWQGSRTWGTPRAAGLQLSREDHLYHLAPGLGFNFKILKPKKSIFPFGFCWSSAQTEALGAHSSSNLICKCKSGVPRLQHYPELQQHPRRRHQQCQEHLELESHLRLGSLNLFLMRAGVASVCKSL